MKQLAERYGRWALVTGASSGIGLEIARQLAAAGMNIVLVARRSGRLETASEQLMSNYHVQTRVLADDLADPQAASRIATAVSDLEIGILVPNAGVELDGEFIGIAPDRQEQLINLNVLAPTQLAQHFGKRMAKRGRGAILFISSLFAYQGTPYFASYAASKAYILILGEALHVELKRRGIDVTVVSPGMTRTEMSANIPINWSKMPIIPLSAEKVAHDGLRSIGRRPSIIPGVLNKLFAWQNRLLPRIMSTKAFGLLIRNAMESGVRKP